MHFKTTRSVVDAQGNPCVRAYMTTDEATQLFHAANRIMALVDEVAETRSDGNGGWQLLDSGDQAAYDQLNGFLAQLQRDLKIEPEVT